MSVLFRGKKDKYYGSEFAVLIEKYNDLNKILLDDVDKKNYGEYNCHLDKDGSRFVVTKPIDKERSKPIWYLHTVHIKNKEPLTISCDGRAFVMYTASSKSIWT